MEPPKKIQLIDAKNRYRKELDRLVKQETRTDEAWKEYCRLAAELESVDHTLDEVSNT
jgi:hypothetical protein